jgi:hypothetical protein
LEEFDFIIQRVVDNFNGNFHDINLPYDYISNTDVYLKIKITVTNFEGFSNDEHDDRLGSFDQVRCYDLNQRQFTFGSRVY